MRKLSLILALTLVALMATASFALANHTSGYDNPQSNANYNGAALGVQGDATTVNTYNNMSAAGSCNACHGFSATGGRPTSTGPHGGYTSSTSKCTACHVIHTKTYGSNAKISANAKLLPANTVTGVCNFCHDLTGTPDAPYSTRYLSANTAIKSGHYVEGAVGNGINAIFNGDATSGTTSNTYGALKLPGLEAGPAGALGDVIPGGDAATGGPVPIVNGLFNQQEFATMFGQKFFTCDSCHSPHAIATNVVTAYWGETERTGVATNRLLKKNLIGAAQNIGIYGSAWCAGCHKGRLSMLNNHPVNDDGPGYLSVATIAALGINDATITNGAHSDQDKNTGAPGTFDKANDEDLAKTNAWYAMQPTYVADDGVTVVSRTVGNDTYGVQKDGYIPIAIFARGAAGGPSCQQCHASARDVESSFFDRIKSTVNSTVYTGNPYTTFPHVSRNKSLLVEAGDDLCTNCHALDLP